MSFAPGTFAFRDFRAHHYAGAFLGVSLLLLLIGATLAVNTGLFLWGAEVAEAEVVSVRQESGTRSPFGYRESWSVLVAVPRPGAPPLMRELMLTTRPGKGQVVEIYRQPGADMRIRSTNPEELWGPIWLFVRMGLIVSAPGFLILLLARLARLLFPSR